MHTFEGMLQKLKEIVGDQKATGWISKYGNVTFEPEDDLEVAAATKEQAELYMNAIISGQPLGKIDKNLILAWEKILEGCCEEIRLATAWVTCVTEKTNNLSENNAKIVIEKLFSEQKTKEYFEGLRAVHRVGERVIASMSKHDVQGPLSMATQMNTFWHTLHDQLQHLGINNVITPPLSPIPVDYLLGTKYCALSLCHFRMEDKRVTWFGKEFILECANFWTNKISNIPPF